MIYLWFTRSKSHKEKLPAAKGNIPVQSSRFSPAEGYDLLPLSAGGRTTRRQTRMEDRLLCRTFPTNLLVLFKIPHSTLTSPLWC